MQSSCIKTWILIASSMKNIVCNQNSILNGKKQSLLLSSERLGGGCRGNPLMGRKPLPLCSHLLQSSEMLGGGCRGNPLMGRKPLPLCSHLLVVWSPLTTIYIFILEYSDIASPSWYNNDIEKLFSYVWKCITISNILDLSTL